MHQIGQRRQSPEVLRFRVWSRVSGSVFIGFLLGQQLFGHFIFHKNMHYDYFMKHAPRTLAVLDAGRPSPRSPVFARYLFELPCSWSWSWHKAP